MYIIIYIIKLILIDLFFYAILKYISNRLLIIIVIFYAILILLIKFYLSKSKTIKIKSIHLNNNNNNNKFKGKRFYSIYKTDKNSNKNLNTDKNTKTQNTKTLKQRFIIGLKHGWNVPLLPDKVSRFHNHPFTRIFRVIGGMSVITVLLKKHLLFLLPFQYLILPLAFIHVCYIIVISIIEVYYGIKMLRSGKLNVKNSPLDTFATYTGKLLYCWKIGCRVSSASVGLAGGSVIADTILEAGGQEKVFTPMIGKGVKFMIGGKPADSYYKDINANLKDLKTTKERLEEINRLAKQCDSALDSNDLSKDEINSVRSAIDEVKKMEKSKLQSYAKDLASKIKEYSENNNNK